MTLLHTSMGESERGSRRWEASLWRGQGISVNDRGFTLRLEIMCEGLLGVFGVAMPLLYGEGTNAFQRLLTEIIRASADQSVLAFGLADSRQGAFHLLSTSPEDCRGDNPGNLRGVTCLARSPFDFRRGGSRAIIRRKQSQAGHYYFTNQGLSIEQRLVQLP